MIYYVIIAVETIKTIWLDGTWSRGGILTADKDRLHMHYRWSASIKLLLGASRGNEPNQSVTLYSHHAESRTLYIRVTQTRGLRWNIIHSQTLDLSNSFLFFGITNGTRYLNFRLDLLSPVATTLGLHHAVKTAQRSFIISINKSKQICLIVLSMFQWKHLKFRNHGGYSFKHSLDYSHLLPYVFDLVIYLYIVYLCSKYQLFLCRTNT